MGGDPDDIDALADDVLAMKYSCVLDVADDGGVSGVELAKKLGISPQAVSVRLQKALHRFAAKLGHPNAKIDGRKLLR